MLYECLNQQREKVDPPSRDGTDESPKKATKMKAYDNFCDRLDQQDMEPFLEQQKDEASFGFSDQALPFVQVAFVELRLPYMAQIETLIQQEEQAREKEAAERPN